MCSLLFLHGGDVCCFSGERVEIGTSLENNLFCSFISLGFLINVRVGKVFLKLRN